jgi:ketosteroid isomerase-like protein
VNLMNNVESEIRETVQAWLSAVQSLDFQAARRLWDGEFDGLLYQPEEHEFPMTDWASIERYWDNVPELVEDVVQWAEIASDVAVLNDVAMVFTRLDTSIKIQDVPVTFDGVVRCSMGLHRKNGSWLLVHYHESRLVAVEDVVAALVG